MWRQPVNIRAALWSSRLAPDVMFNCWKCGEIINLPPASRVASRDTCPSCDSDLHSCRNCRFYDTSKSNQCAEPQAEWVRDKEASNYCDYFAPHPAGDGSAPGASLPTASKPNDAKRKFDSLFKF